MSTFEQEFTSQTADGSSSAQTWEGGLGHMFVSGTFDSCTVDLEVSPDDGTTWVAVGGDASLTAAGCVSFELNPCKVRLTVSSAGASTSINGWLTIGSEGSSRT